MTETRVNLGGLPQTVQDVVTVIHELGETFLWTDIICIDQRDEED
jgi:hypothetical protein